MGIDRIDRTKLSVDELAKLEQYEFNLKQVQRFKDIQGILEEVAGTLADSEELTQESVKKFGALLTDIRESLSSLNKKEAPESPDYAKPVVEELKKLEKALSVAIKGIDTKPQVNVSAPQVTVEPKIDLKGVEKVLKVMPSAFEKAVKQIPETKIKDYSEEWKIMFEKLDSIDTASRIKPQAPTRVEVTNTDGSSIGSLGSLVPYAYDYISASPSTARPTTVVYKSGGSGGTTVATLTIAYDGTTTDITSVTRS